MLLAGGIILFIIAVISNLPSDELRGYKEVMYTPQKGETLWSLAEKNYDGDPRDWVRAVRKLNNDSAWLYAGKTIKILIKGDF